MKKFDELLDEIHEIREDLFNETKEMIEGIKEIGEK